MKHPSPRCRHLCNIYCQSVVWKSVIFSLPFWMWRSLVCYCTGALHLWVVAHLLFFFEEILSCPESDSSEELSELLELLDEELESELESEAWPVDFSRSILLASVANSGSTFWRREKMMKYRKKQILQSAFSERTSRAFSHFLLSFGLPLTVLCQTMGKLVREQKLWVTATVVSRFRTTCQ